MCYLTIGATIWEKEEFTTLKQFSLARTMLDLDKILLFENSTIEHDFSTKPFFFYLWPNNSSCPG